MNFLNWNARGLNSYKKRQILHDILVDHHIDILAIQETKKEQFTNRILRTISTRFDVWYWVPSVGRSGGILFGCDSSLINCISHSIHKFALNVHVENKIDGQKWQITIVYGPVIRTLKKELWIELNHIRGTHSEPWILCGDFNAIRHRDEKSGNLFDITTSARFNRFVSTHQLIEQKLNGRKYT